MKKRKLFNIGALAMGSIAVRLLGMIYKLWLGTAISPIALGIYQLSLTVYSTCVTLTAGGMPSAVARLGARYKKPQEVLLAALRVVMVLCVVLSAFLFFGRDLLAGVVLHGKEYSFCIICLIPGVVFGSIGVLPKGYFHAISRSARISVCEVGEQIAKIVFAFAAVMLFSENETPLVPILALSFGSMVDACIGFAFVGKGEKYKYDKKLTGEIISNALPPTAGKMAGSMLHLITSSALMTALEKNGLSNEAALGQYGILTSLTYPTVFFPLTIVGAVCAVNIPEIAAAQGDTNKIKKLFGKALLFSVIISIGFSLFLLFFAPFLFEKFFSKGLAGIYAVMLIPSVIFMSLKQVCISTLTGMGKLKTLLVLSVADGICGLALTVLLVPGYGIYGFIIGNGIQDFAAFLFSFICYKLESKRICSESLL